MKTNLHFSIFKFVVVIGLNLIISMVSYSQTAKTYNLNIEHNYTDPSNGRKMLKVNFKMYSKGVKGHIIKPVLFVDVEKGVGHTFSDGTPLKYTGGNYTPGYDETWWEENWLGIYNDKLNPLPGNHTYWVRILVWDETLGRYIGDLNDTEWLSYTMEGSTNPSNSGSNYNGGYVPYNPYIYGNNPCGVCSSSGRCLQCNGSGISRNHAPGIVARCGYCGGTGYCATCGGRGYN